MTTQVEQIEWHKYPGEKPEEPQGNNVEEMHLVHHKEIGVTDMWWLDTKWEWEDENVIAWADMPKGWKEG